MANRTDLAQRIEPINQQVAELLRRQETEVTELPTPFFVRGRIHRISSRPPLRPVVFTLGEAESDYLALLGGDLDSFAALSARAGVRLDLDPLRIAYVATFLEATSDLMSGFQILNSFDDIRPLNKPEPAKSERFAELRRNYSGRIVPPKTSERDPWTIELYAVRRRNLVAVRATVQPDGRIAVEEKMLEEAIPVPYSK